MQPLQYRIETHFRAKATAALLLLLNLSFGACSGNASSPAPSGSFAGLSEPDSQIQETTAVPVIPAQAGSASSWQPKTADEFVARGFVHLALHHNAQAKADAERALQLTPACYMASYLHGRAAYEDKDYPAAIEDFDKVIQQRPGWSPAYRYRGLAYSYQGQHQRALPDYEKLVELKPYLAAGYNDLGWAARELGQFDRAKVNLDKTLEIEPDFVRARKNRAILFSNQNDWTAAAAELTTILDLTPGDLWAKEAREEVQRKRPLTSNSSTRQIPSAPEMPRPDVQPKLVSKVEPEYTDEARRAAASAIVLCSLVVSPDGVPEHIEVESGAGFGLDENAIRAVSAWRFKPATREGIPVAAIAHIEVAFRLLVPNHAGQLVRLNFPQQPGFIRPQLIHGKIPDNPKDASDAKIRLTFTVDTEGKLQTISVAETNLNEWAEAALRELESWRFQPATLNGQPAAAKAILELTRTSKGVLSDKPSEAAPTGPDPAWQPTTEDEFLARGYARLKDHKYPQAEGDAEAALRFDPNSATAWFLRARAAYEVKEYSAAINAFDNAIREKPDWPDAYRYRGLAYAYSGQHQEALPDYQKAIELDPDSAPAFNALGWSYTELGQFELARANLDKAIELEPNLIPARENRAKLFARQGNLPAEQDELTVILGLSPADQWAKDTQAAIPQKLP